MLGSRSTRENIGETLIDLTQIVRVPHERKYGPPIKTGIQLYQKEYLAERTLLNGAPQLLPLARSCLSVRFSRLSCSAIWR